MSTKSKVTDGPAGGIVIQLSVEELLFLGIREELLSLAANQRFGAILNYKAVIGSVRKRVECTFSKTRFDDLRLPPRLEQLTTKKGGYYRFHLSGLLNYSPEGLVFGLLPIRVE